MVHATKHSDGSYLVGCAFVSPLTDEELQALLRNSNGDAELQGGP